MIKDNRRRLPEAACYAVTARFCILETVKERRSQYPSNNMEKMKTCLKEVVALVCSWQVLLIAASITNCEIRYQILKSAAQDQRTSATSHEQKTSLYSKGGRLQLVTNFSSARRSS